MNKLKITVIMILIMIVISTLLYAGDNRVVIIPDDSTSKWVISLLEGNDEPPFVTMIFSSVIVIDDNGGIHIAYSWAKGSTTWESVKEVKGQLGIKYVTLKNGRLVKEQVSSEIGIGTKLSMTVIKGIPYISFWKWPDPSILIAKRTEQNWNVEILDKSTSAYSSVFSLIADKNGYLHVIYVIGPPYKIMYGKRSETEWTKEELPLYTGYIGGLTISDYENAVLSLAVDNNNKPHIAGKRGTSLRYIKKTDGNWQATDVENNITVWKCSINIDKNNYPQILYICTPKDTQKYELRYAKLVGTTWNIIKIMDLPENSISTSFLLDFKLDGSEYVNIIVSWKDSENKVAMKYIKFKDISGNIENIDSNQDNMGESLSMALDTNSIIHVTYSGSGGGLWYATKIQKIAESREDKLIPVNNLFNPSTSDKATIIYKLSQQGLAKVKIYTINGELIRTLVEEDKAEGTYTVEWDGKDEFGGNVGNGLYFVVFEAPNVKEVKKICIVK